MLWWGAWGAGCRETKVRFDGQRKFSKLAITRVCEAVQMINKYQLLGQGLFPETLPPCFDAMDLKRALRGIVPTVRDRRFRKRSSPLVPYNGTKHDGSRRAFATPNPIQYFHVCEFMYENWDRIENKIKSSPFVVSQPKPANPDDDRPVLIPSLSNLTKEASEKLRYSPIIVRADISQFFPSVYTHAISWVAHGRDAAKADQNPESTANDFNSLDYFIQHCQNSETRGVAVGPDAFRVVAEFIASEVDNKLSDACGERIIGGARHVDDFFLGVATETDAQFVLSSLRSVLSEFHFQLNDTKTKITSGLEPLNEVWAQDFRKEVSALSPYLSNADDWIRLIGKATALSADLMSSSPVKILVRAMDDQRIYRSFGGWQNIEPYLQRLCFHYSHALDYVFLLVVKRSALGLPLDKDGWKIVAESLINKHGALGHTHEVVWSTWLHLSLGNDMEDRLVSYLTGLESSYLHSLLVSAFAEGRLSRKPPMRYGSHISSDGGRWLDGLVARSAGFSKAKFSGDFSQEFTHLADKGLKLVDWDSHLAKMEDENENAISRTRYGYDSDDDDDFFIPDDDDPLADIDW